MTPGWVVIWRGKSCVTYWTIYGDWSLDPDEAKVFTNRISARIDTGMRFGYETVRCWT